MDTKTRDLLKEGLKILGSAAYVSLGMWLIVGTFTFGFAPAWYVILHMIVALLYLFLSPIILHKLGVPV